MCQESLARSEVRENRASKPPTDAAANTRAAIATSTADSNSMVSPRGRVQICGKNGYQWMNACVCEKNSLLVPFQALIFSQLPKKFDLSSFTKCPNSCWQMHAPLSHLCFDGCGATHCKVLQLQNGLDNGIFSLAKMKYFFSWYCCHVNFSFRQLGCKILIKMSHKIISK